MRARGSSDTGSSGAARAFPDVAAGRAVGLGAFLETFRVAVTEGTPSGGPARAVLDRVVDALGTTGGARVRVAGTLTPCALVEPVVDALAPRGPGAHPYPDVPAGTAAHARALAALVPTLAWWRRPDRDEPDEAFARGHANATIVGGGGLEERDDVWIGVSVLAPHVAYPEHRHAPSEIYLAMTAGQWWREGEPWHEPGIGGVVHNAPNVRHAMRSGESPLLTTWCLWRGDRSPASMRWQSPAVRELRRHRRRPAKPACVAVPVCPPCGRLDGATPA